VFCSIKRFVTPSRLNFHASVFCAKQMGWKPITTVAKATEEMNGRRGNRGFMIDLPLGFVTFGSKHYAYLFAMG